MTVRMLLAAFALIVGHVSSTAIVAAQGLPCFDECNDLIDAGETVESGQVRCCYVLTHNPPTPGTLLGQTCQQAGFDDGVTCYAVVRTYDDPFDSECSGEEGDRWTCPCLEQDYTESTEPSCTLSDGKPVCVYDNTEMVTEWTYGCRGCPLPDSGTQSNCE